MRQAVRFVLCESIVVDESPVGAGICKKHLVGIHAALRHDTTVTPTRQVYRTNEIV